MLKVILILHFAVFLSGFTGVFGRLITYDAFVLVYIRFIIAGLAAMEVEGVASMAGNATRELISKLGMKSLSKGVKVDVLDGIVTVSLALNLNYGYSIKEITSKVQEKVKTAIENMTGLEVADVNIRVAGVEIPEEA